MAEATGISYHNAKPLDTVQTDKIALRPLDNNSDNSANQNKNDDDDQNANDDINVQLIPIDGIKFVDYTDESQLDHVMSLVGRDLSEPYSIFTYRYFLHRFPQLCILAVDVETNEPIGCVVGKIDEEEELITSSQQHQQQLDTKKESSTSKNQNHDTVPQNGVTKAAPAHPTTKIIHNIGYIGMLAVSEQYRRRGIGKALVQRILVRMRYDAVFHCTSVTLETEVTNVTAQLLYQNYFGFIREELLVRYYLNWNDAYRLRLWF